MALEVSLDPFSEEDTKYHFNLSELVVAVPLVNDRYFVLLENWALICKAEDLDPENVYDGGTGGRLAVTPFCTIQEIPPVNLKSINPVISDSMLRDRLISGLKVEAETDEDVVNHPDHYTGGDIECIDAIQASMTHLEFMGYLKGNAEKYLWRYRMKGKPQEDLEKARWYITKMLEVDGKRGVDATKVVANYLDMYEGSADVGSEQSQASQRSS